MESRPASKAAVAKVVRARLLLRLLSNFSPQIGIDKSAAA
jgi:hypothetical protein